MKIAIITFHRAYNCGAMLQAWALKTVLVRLGHEAYFLEDSDLGRNPYRTMLACRCRDGSFFRRWRSFVYRLAQTVCGKRIGVKTGRLYDSFRRRNLPERREHQKDLGKNIDVLILGSDQVLNPVIAGWSPYFLCEAVPNTIRKIVYAGSIGDNGLPVNWSKRINDALKGFNSVSLREHYDDYVVTADPTLLLRAEDYDSITEHRGVRSRGRYLFMYSCTFTDFEITTAREVARRLGLRSIFAHPWGRYFRKDVPEMLDWISPELFLRYFRDAEVVIAGSFHATVFSLLLGKRFVTLRTKVDKRVSRPAELLRRVGLTSRLANPETLLEDIVDLLQKDVPYSAYEQMDALRQESIVWLRNALKK